jgi:hypothetical protein
MRQYTEVVAQEIGCPEWIVREGESSACDRDNKNELCYCEAAAKRILSLHDAEIMAKITKVML